ncbi:GGDEF domain-containing protein [Streptomyces sp. NP160]|uniref:putative bifunctional diguanylate cyclase/phosphodiesterase n=1 Tax=Streptomyces sp. NP160 TaxID=2586637 RepID=UPI001117AECB|nr:bifunctional diguanylate cyclase/phosphodiesterase [Streptomyces sp. NP160]TNM68463.1 GGDEF domain-containing protein [Streptomyces sp. NP160]
MGGTSPRSLTAVALVAVGVLAAATVVVAGAAGTVHAFPVGAAASALVGLAAALSMLLRRGAGGAERTMGLAVGLWAAGQAWIALLALRQPGLPQQPTPGDALQTFAAPLALVAVMALPRPSGYAGRRRQLALDGAVVAATGAALLWRVAFLPLDPSGTAALTAGAVVLADLAVLGLCVQLAVAGLDRGAALVALGVGLFVSADLVNTHDLVQPGGTWPWSATAAACAAWPLVAAGFAAAGRQRLGGPRLEAFGADVRTGAVTTALVIVQVLAALVSSTVSDRPVDAVTGVLFGVVVASLVTRELVHRGQRSRLVEELRHQALHDPLTGLANRHALSARLAELAQDPELAGDPGRGDRVTAVVLDVDGFREVNTRLGHAAGDQLLRVLAQRVSAALPAGWTAHHYGGDEFVAAGPGDLARGTRVAAALLDAVAAPVELAVAGAVAVTACAGVSSAADGETDPLTAVAEATGALREAQAAGRGRVHVHDEAAHERSARRLQVRERLREAVAAGTVTAALQPVVDVATGATTGFEALARWRDAELGDVRPDEFIAVAEEAGLVPAVGAAVLRAGLVALQQAGGVERRLRLAVNASPLELRAPGYVDGVLGALADAGVPVDLLTVEVTEGLFMTTDDPAVAVLAELGAAGARVAVDDFGTGYSSLSYLERLPVHIVKIDRSLVSGVDRSRPRAVLEAVVALCRALDLEVVAEGVETAEQAAVVRGLGVQRGQGWYWSRPLPPELVAQHVAERSAAL